VRVALLVAIAACGDDLHLASGDATLMVSFGGLDRIVIVHAPALRLPHAPLVLSLHGSGGIAAGQQAAVALDPLADQDGFITAYPQAAIPYGGGFEWHVPGVPLNQGPEPPDAPDDVGYVAAAIDAIDRQFHVDRSRIFASGFSGGARMTSSLGCDLPEIVAIAPMSGVRYPAPCAARPLTVIAFHGSADPTNPYDGNGAAFWTYSVPDAMAGWAAQEGCAASPEVTTVAPDVQLASYPSCAHDATVALYLSIGEGHQLPVGIDANQTMWLAFSDVVR